MNFKEIFFFPPRCRKIFKKENKMWGTESLGGAIKAVREKERSSLKISELFSELRALPDGYINSRIMKLRVEALLATRVGRKLVVPVQIENKIVNYWVLKELSFLPNDKSIKMAFQLVIRNNLRH
jgi:hypothetical protein